MNFTAYMLQNIHPSPGKMLENGPGIKPSRLNLRPDVIKLSVKFYGSS
jgi:hypothetical protein